MNKRTVEIYSPEKQINKSSKYNLKKNDPEFKEKLKNRHYKYIERNPHQYTLRMIINNYLKPRKTTRRNGCRDNRGVWHIDHIKPISTFKPDDPISIVNAIENLRPIWKSDNLKRRKNGF